MSDQDYTALLLEEIRDQNRAVLEYVRDVPAMAARLERVEEKVDGLEADMKVVKAAVTDVSQQQANHEQRILRLEAA